MPTVVAQRLVNVPDDVAGGVQDALGVAIALPVDNPGDSAPLLAVTVVVEARERFTVWLDLPDVAVAGLGGEAVMRLGLSAKITAKVVAFAERPSEARASRDEPLSARRDLQPPSRTPTPDRSRRPTGSAQLHRWHAAPDRTEIFLVEQAGPGYRLVERGSAGQALVASMGSRPEPYSTGGLADARGPSALFGRVARP
jgi:hypothetical protein